MTCTPTRKIPLLSVTTDFLWSSNVGRNLTLVQTLNKETCRAPHETQYCSRDTVGSNLTSELRQAQMSFGRRYKRNYELVLQRHLIVKNLFYCVKIRSTKSEAISNVQNPNFQNKKSEYLSTVALLLF